MLNHFLQKNILTPLLMTLCSFLLCSAQAHALSAWEESNMTAQINAIKAFSQGRVGLMVHFMGTGESFSYSAEERFPFCSTVKLIVAAAILHKSQNSTENPHFLQQKLVVPQDLVTYSPALTGRSGTELSIQDLCIAMVQESDNTATNMLLESLGGPLALQQFARITGGKEFRMEDYEPQINEAKPTDKRNASTPLAMISLMNEIFFGNVLNEHNKTLLQTWIAHTRTGNNLIREATPQSWQVWHKSGAGAHGSIGDIAVIFPDKHSSEYMPHVYGDGPILLAIYMTGSSLSYDERADFIRQLTKIALRSK